MNNTGFGIWSASSFFTVAPSINTRNTFTNLTYGIAAFSVLNLTRTATIDRSDFYNNYRGIYLSSIPMATVTRNNFEVYRWPTQLTNEAYGLYLNFCTGFKVEENDFTYSLGNTPPANAYGIIVNQSNSQGYCGQDDEIYRNTFHNIMVGIQAQGNNSEKPYASCYPNAPSTPNNVGLVLRCNEFYNGTVDVYDIRVADYIASNGTVPGDIAHQQGTCIDDKSPANNLFSHSLNNPENDFIIDATYSAGNPNLVDYSWASANQTVTALTPLYYTPPVAYSGVDPDDCSGLTYSPGTSCPSRFTYIPINGSFHRDISLYTYRADSLNNILATGDAPSLYAIVSTGTPGQIGSGLLNTSPYLSDGVLIAAINRGLPPGILKNIILANSPMSPAVVSALNAVNLPAGVRGEINAAQNGVSARDELVDLMSHYISAKSYATNELIRYYLNDTLLTDGVDSIIYVLKKYQIPEFRCSLVKAYSDKGDTLSAKLHRDTLEMENGLDNFCRLFDVLLQLERVGQSCFGLAQDPIKQATVTSISANYEQKACAEANALLHLVMQYQLMEYINSVSITSNRSAPSAPELTTNGTQFSLFPNPNNGNFSVAYNSKETDVVELEFYNITGACVMKKLLVPGNQVAEVDCSGMVEGVYVIRLVINGLPSDSQKLLITE